ncbi:hypothetical protein FCIRC_6050 [Fusarium circinatum]|uniref:Uncharacterized protein n=1 Tax=Fusarium circinatum TaxID=48490 RepID=A0A8H5U4K2_FUSCI|nr:hypothetical protein FCIRC_6050 [Fusarium circinatum]
MLNPLPAYPSRGPEQSSDTSSNELGLNDDFIWLTVHGSAIYRIADPPSGPFFCNHENPVAVSRLSLISLGCRPPSPNGRGPLTPQVSQSPLRRKMKHPRYDLKQDWHQGYHSTTAPSFLWLDVEIGRLQTERAVYDV